MNIHHEQTDYAPHKCTECGDPAYIPFTGPARCTNWKCNRFDLNIFKEHTMSLPDSGDPEPEEDIENDPTQPRLQGLAAWHPDRCRGSAWGPFPDPADFAEFLQAWRAIEDAIDYVPKLCYTQKDGPERKD